MSVEAVEVEGSGDGGERGTRVAGGASADTGPDVTGRRFRSLVEGAPVVGFTGANGAGKTLVAVSEAVHDMRQGRRVYSTVPIVCSAGRSAPILSLRQLLDLRDCTVLIDEVSVVFSSRATGSLPDEVVTFLQSMRHQGITLRWTAPAWMRADILLREVTQVSVGVTGLARYRRPGAFWPTPRFVLAGALDTVGIGLDKAPEKIIGRRIWRPSSLLGWGAYDSEADVTRVGWPRPSGTCVDCGGRTKATYCSSERHAALGIAPLAGVE